MCTGRAESASTKEYDDVKIEAKVAVPVKQ